jgi:hypoxanthine phosphoribosyltransferase
MCGVGRGNSVVRIVAWRSTALHNAQIITNARGGILPNRLLAVRYGQIKRSQTIKIKRYANKNNRAKY